MNSLNEFISYMDGTFDNRMQKEELERTDQEAALKFPFAKHVNHVCNDKIEHLPEDFKGVFVVEESYYTTNETTNPNPHLFLFTEEEGKVKLTSYELPEGFKKDDFTYEHIIEPLHYEKLCISEKFTPMYYDKLDGVYTGKSVSMFSPVLKFTISEQISKEVMRVSECFEVNGKRTFGFDIPIEYRRCNEVG